MTLTASIVLYKSDPEVLHKCISSFLDTQIDVKLFLIDNSPTSELQEFSIDNRVNYIYNPSNPGFGISHNIAIDKVFEINSNYHLVLNPDIYFQKGTLEKIIEFLECNVSVGLLMPKVLYPDETFQYLCKQKPTVLDLFLRGFAPNIVKKFFKKRINNFCYKNYNLNSFIFDVPYLSGCFMFFRLNELKKLGGFDPRFFMYMEDADLSYRFYLYSKTCYFPYAHVYHYYSGLTHKSLKYKLITIKSVFIYFNKWGWLKNIL